MADDVSRRGRTARRPSSRELAFMKSARPLEELLARSIPLLSAAGMLCPCASCMRATSA